MLASWAQASRGWTRRLWRCTIEIVKRSDLHTFKMLPRRWVVERTFGWLGRYRRLNRDYERQAGKEYGFDFRYSSRPGWETYASLLEFADVVRRDLREMRPRDLIDIQSFIRVLGSNEY